jgi:membrane protease YdiL (CAAX protease family)
MTEEAPRKLGWGRFALQVVTVALAFIAASLPPVLGFGQTSSAGLALSALSSAAGGLLVAWLWLRSDRALADAFNLSRPASWSRALGMALAATAAIVVVLLAGSLVSSAAGFEAPQTSGVIELVRQGPLHLLMWIALVAWGSAAFGEELLWRGFLMDRLGRLPGLGGQAVAVVVIQAALFALPHLYQGWSGAVVTGTVGLILGWMRLRTGGNLWPLIIAHGLVDTIMLTAGYFDAFAGLAG